MNRELLEKYGYSIPQEPITIDKKSNKSTKKSNSESQVESKDDVGLNYIIEKKPADDIVREFIKTQLDCVVNEDDIF